MSRYNMWTVLSIFGPVVEKFIVKLGFCLFNFFIVCAAGHGAADPCTHQRVVLLAILFSQARVHQSRINERGCYLPGCNQDNDN